jgi:site-specific DNA recombinase
MNKQAAIYARVSTDDQAERGYSLPSQVEACQRFAWQKGFDVAAVFQDDISGAKPVTRRPEGVQLQRAIDSGQVNSVIIYQVDRLSRDIVDLLTTVRDWLQTGVEIYSLDVGQITSELDIVLVIKGWQGSDERKKIIERTTRGRDTKARSGRVVGVGTPPYGYIYQDGELLIEETEAQIVRMIYDLYINGDENGKLVKMTEIASCLTKMGIPTPSERYKGKKKNAVAGRWSDSSVYRILIAETYCGILRYGKLIGWAGQKGKRPTEEQIVIEVPAIISHETWQIAQERRAYNFKMSKRRAKRDYLLRGIIFCGCGKHLVGTSGRYGCTGRQHNSFIPTDCKEPKVPGWIIESMTWDYVMSLITSPEKFEEKLREAQAKELEATEPKYIELEHIQALIEQTEREADEIAGALPRTRGLVAARLEQQAEEVERRYQALLTRQAELQEALTLELTDGMIADLLSFRETVATGLSNPTYEDKRRWLEILQVEVRVQNRQAIISCRISNKPFIFDLVSSRIQTEQNQGGRYGFYISKNTTMVLLV